MKTNIFLLITLAVFSSTHAFAKIVEIKNQFHLITRIGSTPIHSLNNMIKEKSVSKIELYQGGNVHMISFAKKNGPVKLYSVDNNGYIYSIEPFTDYTVTDIDVSGKVQFREVPNRKYVVSEKGYFLY